MCGIVGVIKTDNKGIDADWIKKFESMLLMSQLRGIDGTGIMFRDPQSGQVQFEKEAENSLDFIRGKNWANIKEKVIGTSVLIGHCRSKTVGSKIRSNTHPFVIDDEFGLVHNGTLRDEYNPKEIRHYSVDSQYLAETLHKNGFSELKNITGDTALACILGKKNQAVLYRNLGRPLFFMQDGNTFVFASQQVFIESILPFWEVDPKSKIFALKEDTLTTIDLTAPLGFVNTYIKMREEPKIKDTTYYSSAAYSGKVNDVQSFPVAKVVSSKIRKGSIKLKIKTLTNEVLDVVGKLGKQTLPCLEGVSFSGQKELALGDRISIDITDIIQSPARMSGNRKDVYRVEGISNEYPEILFYGYTTELSDDDLLNTMSVSGTVANIKILDTTEKLELGSPLSSLIYELSVVNEGVI